MDDGPEATARTALGAYPISWDIKIVRPQPLWQPGQNTQARNIREGLRHLDPDLPIAIIEDDDFYSPEWLQTVVDWLERDYELIGEEKARYYSLPTSIARTMRNTRHASLCATAFRGREVYNSLLELAQADGRKFIDKDLWAQTPSGLKTLLPTHHVVGIKGLPGRHGIGCGHKPSFSGKADPKGVILRSWVGDAAYKAYKEL